MRPKLVVAVIRKAACAWAMCHDTMCMTDLDLGPPKLLAPFTARGSIVVAPVVDLWRPCALATACVEGRHGTALQWAQRSVPVPVETGARSWQRLCCPSTCGTCLQRRNSKAQTRAMPLTQLVSSKVGIRITVHSLQPARACLWFRAWWCHMLTCTTVCGCARHTEHGIKCRSLQGLWIAYEAVLA